MVLTFLLVAAIALVAYVFVGYPAIVALLARFRPRPIASDCDATPRLSVIVLAYNEESVIGARLENLRSLDYPPEALEVIVVADGSSDSTEAVASRVPGVRVLFDPARAGKLAAMHRGAAAATGEILLFSDANNAYTRETLRELVAPFADPSVGVVTGRKAIDDGTGRPLDRAEGLYWRYEDKIKRWESASGSVPGAAGEIVAFRRESFPSAKPGTMNDDFVQALTAGLAGWRIVYARRAVSLERASATLGDEAIRRSRLTTGRWQALVQLLPALARRQPGLAWRVVSHKFLRPVVPFALAAIVLASVLLSPSRSWALGLVLAQGAFYAAAVGGWVSERLGRRSAVLYLPYYFCRMNLATLAGFRNFAGGRHVAVWARVDRG